MTLVELAAAQEAAAADGRWDDLLELQERLREALAEPHPRDELEEAHRRTEATGRLLTGALVERQSVLERLRVGRRAVGAYTRSARQ